MGDRIAKVIARSGVCSRREAERLIAAGRVSINDKVLQTPAYIVKAQDKITVDDRQISAPEPVRLWRYYKPAGLVTTHNDPEGRPTVFAALPPELPRVISVGRLDFNTEGLLLLTNDGGLSRYMELPTTGWSRRYRVRARGRLADADIKRLQQGMEIDGVKYGPATAKVDSTQGANTWFTLVLCEGKNREIRRMAEELGLQVNRLIRISYGPFGLDRLASGEISEVKSRVISEQLGAGLKSATAHQPGTQKQKRYSNPTTGKRRKIQR
jgi:23S rRNA pseudouridine2605 synthase